MNISHWIDHWATHTPDKVAIHFEGDEIRYGRLADEISRLAHGLREFLEVGSGDRIAVLGLNHPRMLSLFFACARLGAILVPLNFRLAPREQLETLRDCAARVLFAGSGFEHAAASLAADLGVCRVLALESTAGRHTPDSFDSLLADAELGAPDATLDYPLLLVYTSGATGSPKGVLLTQSAVQWNAVNSQAAHELRRDDHVLADLPLFHVGGLNIQITPALHLGATVTLRRKFDPTGWLQAVSRARPSLSVLVPAQMPPLFEHPQWQETDLSSLRCLTTGSTIVPRSLIEVWHARGVPVIQVYGCTESCPIAVHQLREQASHTVGSVGKPALHCAARIVDEQGKDVAPMVRGEVVLRGPNVTRGYWRGRYDESFRDGWFHTGDIGYCDDEGWFYIVDRKKDLIISGGENVYPAEVEAAIREHPGVAEAAVVGVPHPRWGEVPVAAVVSRGEVNEAALRIILEDRLGRFKHPREIRFVDALPRNAMGKVVKDDVRALFDDAAGSGETPE